MIGLNKNLLTAMAGVTDFATNPAVAGTGIALSAIGGIYKLVKDSQKQNQDLFDTERKYKNLKVFGPDLKNIIKMIPDFGMRVIATILNRNYEHSVKASMESQNYLSPEKDERSKSEKFIGLNSKYNPLFQLPVWLLKGLTPTALQKIYGFDKQGLKKEKLEIKERAKFLGVSLTTSQLLGKTAQQIVATPDTYEGKMFKLALAQTDHLRYIGESVTTIWKKLGAEKIIGFSENVEQDIFSKIASIPKMLLNIPGINATKNLVKGGFSILTSPFKALASIGNIMDKIEIGYKQFVTGNIFKAQDRKDWESKAGIKKASPEDIKHAEMNLMSSMQDISVKQLRVQLEMLKALNKMSNSESDLNFLKKKHKVFNEYSGQFTDDREYYGKIVKDAMRTIYNKSKIGRIRGTIGGILGLLPRFLGGRNEEEDFEVENERIMKAYGYAGKVKGHLSRTGIDKKVVGKKAWRDAYRDEVERRMKEREERIAVVEAGGSSVGAITREHEQHPLTWKQRILYMMGLEDTARGAGRKILSKLRKEQSGGEEHLFDEEFGKIPGSKPVGVRGKPYGITSQLSVQKNNLIPFNPLSNISSWKASYSYFKSEYVSVGDQLIFQGLASIWMLFNDKISNLLEEIRDSSNFLSGFNRVPIPYLEDVKNYIRLDFLGTGKLLTELKTTYADGYLKLSTSFADGYLEVKSSIDDLTDAFKTKFSLAAHYFAGGVIPGKPPINKKEDNVFVAARSGERVLTEEQNFILVDSLKETVDYNRKSFNVLNEIKDRQPTQEEQRFTKEEEKSRWNKLIETSKETKDTLKGKISYYLRDAWEKVKFGKKKKEGEEGDGIFKGALGVLGSILTGIGGFIGGIFSGKLLKGALGFGGKALGFGSKILKKALLPLTALFSGIDAYKGWEDAANISGSEKPSFFQKLGSGMAGMISGLTWGLIEPKTIYDFFSPVAGWIGDKMGQLKDWFLSTQAGTNFSAWKVADTFDGFGKSKAGEISGSKDANFFQRMGAGVSGMLSSATLGMVTPDTFYEYISGTSSWISDKMNDVKIWFLQTQAGTNFSKWKVRDTFEGINNAESITGLKEPNFINKLGAGMSSILSSLTLGMIPPQTMYNLVSKTTGWVTEKVMDFTKEAYNQTMIPFSPGNMKKWAEETIIPSPDEIFTANKVTNPGFLNYLDAYTSMGVHATTNGLINAKDYYGWTNNLQNDISTTLTSSVEEKAKSISSTKNINPYIKKGFNAAQNDWKTITGSSNPSFFQQASFEISGYISFITGNDKKKIYDAIHSPIDFIDKSFNKILNWFTPNEAYAADTIPENPFVKIKEEVNKLDDNTLYGRLLGPVWIKAKSLYHKIMGKPLVKESLQSFSAVDKSKFNLSGETQRYKTSDINNTQYDDVHYKSSESSPLLPKLPTDNVPLSTEKMLLDDNRPLFKGLTEDQLKGDTVKLGSYNVNTDVYKAIQQASVKYGVPLDYMLAMAAQESNFNPNIKAPTSSATGLYQFISSTWKSMWKGGDVPDPRDPFANADAGARYAKEAEKILGTSDPAALYLGHFLGPFGAKKLINAMMSNPMTPASSVVGEKQMWANSSVFTPGSTVSDIYKWSKRKMGSFISKLGGSMSESDIAKINERQIPQKSETSPAQPIGKQDFTDIPKQPQTRSSQNIESVGATKVLEEIAALKQATVEIPKETPVGPLASQASQQPVNINNFSAPTNTIQGPHSGNNYEKQFDPQLGFLDELFNSAIAGFTNASRSFVFGESLNANFARS